MTLIEKLKDCANFYTNDPQCKDDDLALGIAQGVNLALNIVKQHSDWVSVDERLPSENTTVLVYKQKFNLIGIAEYIGNNFWKFTTPSNDRMNTYMGSVSHWQPLPQPPSEVQIDSD